MTGGSRLSAFLIETQQAVDNVDEILDAASPDIVIFGTGDYQVEVGFDAEKVRAAAKRVWNSGKAHNVATSIVGATASALYGDPGKHVRIIGNASLIAAEALRRAVDTARADDGRE